MSYGPLAFLLVLSVPARRSPFALGAVLFLATIAYGVMIEFVQRMTGRQFELMDMAMNALGAVVGTVAGILARRIAERSGSEST